MSYALFDGSTAVDFSQFELNPGHVGGSGGSADNVDPSTSYGTLDDAYRTTPDANGNRVTIVTGLATVHKFPGNKAIKVTLRSGDGTVLLGPGTSGDVDRINWSNRPESTYDSSVTGKSGSARPAALLPAPASGGVGFGNPAATLPGDERLHGHMQMLDATFPTRTSGWNFVGWEWHTNAGGPQPAIMAVDLLYGQPRLVLRGGDAGSFNTDFTLTVGPFLQRHVYFDDTGFIDLVEGPPGGGNGTYTSLITGQVLPAGQGVANGTPVTESSYCYPGRGVWALDKSYALAFKILYSDRDGYRSAFLAGTGGPLCAVTGYFAAWFIREDWSAWKVLCPKVPIATCYSVYDRRYSVRKSAGMYGLLGQYAPKNQGLAAAPVYFGAVKVEKAAPGVTLASVTFDGSDPELSPSGQAPVNTSAPVVTGTAKTGYQLSGTNGGWNGTGITYAYQWQLDDGAGNFVDVSSNGATAKYIVPANAINRSARLKVTATNATGSATAVSNAIGPMALGPLDPGVRDDENPISQNGLWQVLQVGIPRIAVVSNHLASPASGDHQACRTDISSADNGAIVTLDQAPGVGTSDGFSLIVRAQNPNSGTHADYRGGYTDGVGWRIFKCINDTSFTQLGATLAGNAPAAGYKIRLTAIGDNLVLSYSSDGGTTWTATVTTTGGNAISGAGTIGLEIAGTTLLMSNFDQVAVASPPTNSSVPVITGALPVGSALLTTNGGWNNAPTSFAYQWRRDVAGNGVFSDIPGATDKSYTTVQADVGSNLTVVVTATNPNGSASSTAVAVGPIAQVAPSVQTSPVATGSPIVGRTLSCTSGVYAPAGTYTVAYQWQRRTSTGALADIAAATASTYVPVSGDTDYILSCRVTATNAGGATAVNSNELAPIAAAPSARRFWWNGAAWV